MENVFKFLLHVIVRQGEILNDLGRDKGLLDIQAERRQEDGIDSLDSERGAYDEQ